MTKRELHKRMRQMVAAMRAEGAKFPPSFISPLRDAYFGDGPMSTSNGVHEPHGVCGCLDYWSERQGIFSASTFHDVLKCRVGDWPKPWRNRYRRVKTVRAQYRVMADFVEAEVLK